MDNELSEEQRAQLLELLEPKRRYLMRHPMYRLFSTLHIVDKLD